MKYELFSKLYQEVKDYNNIDMYISERGWQDWMDEYSVDSDANIVADILRRIYAIGNMSIREMREKIGLSRAAFGKRYLISSNTLQDWEYGKNRTPDYIKIFVAYTLFAGQGDNIDG